VQEFEVVMQRTVREEFMSVYAKQQKIQQEMEETEAAIGSCLEDMDRMQELLDKLDKLQQQVQPIQSITHSPGMGGVEYPSPYATAGCKRRPKGAMAMVPGVCLVRRC
jgi:hypothetical protein